MSAVAPIHATPAHNLSQSARAERASQTTFTPDEALPSLDGDVIARLNYFSPPQDGSTPFNYVERQPEGQPQRNFTDFTEQVTIHDIRGQESYYNLDKDAFAVISGVPESSEKYFTDDESIKRNYYPELEQLLLENVPGSNRVVFFDHTIRRANPSAPRNPVTRVHVDQTAASAAARVRLHLGPDADTLLKGRYRIINVWRPLNGPVVSFPLAYASSASVDDKDIVPVEHRYPDRTGQTAGVKYNGSQKWHYLSRMTNDERILLECFDSEALQSSSVKGGRAPHSAFEDPGTPAGAPGRESIEVRALVFGP